jgi:iron uptake system component EfeO
MRVARSQVARVRVARVRTACVVGALLAAASAGAAMVEAASGAAAATAGAEQDGFRLVKVRITKADCELPERLPAGPVLLEVSIAPGVDGDELELIDRGGQGQVTELEGIAAGATGDFAMVLVPGKYQVLCPGAKRGKTSLRVTGRVPAPPTGPAVDAADRYTQYLLAQAQALRVDARALKDAVNAGDMELARGVYESAREAYGQVAPSAAAYGSLAQRLDGPQGSLPKAKWTGFRRIEQGLWVDGSVAGLAPVVDQLVNDVDQLYGVIGVLPPTPAQALTRVTQQLKAASVALGDNVKPSPSQLGLVDAGAVVAGAHGGYDAVAPLIGSADVAVADAASAAFTAADDALAAGDVAAVRVALDGLAKALVAVAAKV